ncbi:hypothetical protein COY27_07130 [Candidatus Woesearchaeota archaeon CG_4_10_14_0_2_um_filter_33_13]|nr:MAG: hypothetical protein COY27_07130 [Candidatus Woesearchaeota archaeon CG_4_10_14_0_2_um_filter_33_13]
MKQLSLQQLTDKDKYIIAEYIYSFHQDILIKSDAQEVLNMFDRKGINVIGIELEKYTVMNLIRKHVGVLDRQEIMEQYYSNNITN